MARKKKEIESGGGGSWMDTYGDLVTLLLTFFVLLFSFSTLDTDKWRSLVGAFTGMNVIQIPSFSPEMALESPIPQIAVNSRINDTTDPEAPSPQELADYQGFNELIFGIEDFVQKAGMQADIEAKYDTFSIIIRFEDKILFSSGSDRLLPESYEVLDHMVELLSSFDRLIYRTCVEGHTDNLPISTARFRDNWDLSSYRANNVVRYLRDTGQIDTQKIYSAGWGDEYPIDTNDTPEGRANNRRVEFVIESLVESTRWNPDE